MPSICFDTIPSAPNQRVLEHGRTIPGNVFVEQDARLGIAQQSRERGLAFEEWEIAEVLAIMLDPVKGVQHRAMCSLSTT